MVMASDRDEMEAKVSFIIVENLGRIKAEWHEDC
jgi:hypothetical protein